MVKHVFLHWVVPEICLWNIFGVFELLWILHAFSEKFTNSWISQSQLCDKSNHILGTTQLRKTCITILKFAYSQLKNALLCIKICQYLTNLLSKIRVRFFLHQPLRSRCVPNASLMRSQCVPHASPMRPPCVPNASPMRPQCVYNAFPMHDLARKTQKKFLFMSAE